MDTKKEQIIKQRIAELSNKLNNSIYTLEQSELTIKEKINEIESLTKSINDLTIALKIIQEIIASFSIERIKKLEKIVTKCLKTVFFDKELEFEIEIIDKKTGKSVVFSILESIGDKTNKYPLSTNSVAGGIVVVTAFIIQIYFIRYFKLPSIVFLDEAFSQVSDQYIPYLNQLLYGLKDAYGLIIVLITHDPRFSELADRTYNVKNGCYSLDI